jgi:Zn-finger nucleic acid-binding protein
MRNALEPAGNLVSYHHRSRDNPFLAVRAGVYMSSPARCPRCVCPMDHIHVGLIDIDRCPCCGGVWLDYGELTKLRSNETAMRALDVGPARAARLRHVVGALRCPRDQRPLEHAADIEQPHVSVEHCFYCRGLFLDAGELRDLGEITLREWLRGLKV